MATFNIVLDKRTKLKQDNYNLAIRLVNGNDVMYINVSKMTENQYDQVFIKKFKDKESIAFRDKCNGYISKCESIFSELKPFNKARFRELFKDKDKGMPKSLLLSELFDFGSSRATFDHHMRNLRTIINYFLGVVKIIPEGYEYPFGKGGFTISSYFPSKEVLKECEVESIVELKKFKSEEHEYARDIWLLLYRCNGANFADLLRMKWSQISGDCIIFTRKKTENTRKNNKKPIIVPLSEKLLDSINKVGNKTTPYLLGLLEDGYDEISFKNKNHRIKQQINRKLKDIRIQLKLSIPLQLGKARDSYASTLLRNGESRDDIGQMMGHSNSVVTEHYLPRIDREMTHKINKSLL
jgi:Phage integrase family.